MYILFYNLPLNCFDLSVSLPFPYKMTLRDLYTYWFQNPQVWFDATPDDDLFISHKFRNHVKVSANAFSWIDYNNLWKEALIGMILALDQIPRHMKRCEMANEADILEYTKTASLFSDITLSRFQDFTCEELCFVLMPYRHLHKIENAIEIMNAKLQTMTTVPTIAKRFLRAAYKSLIIQNNANMVSNVQTTNTIATIEHTETLKSVSLPVPARWKQSLSSLTRTETVLISLSGGVDSVVLLHCLLSLNYRVRAIHINYCNRFPVSDHEQTFVEGLCKKLGVPLTVRRFQEFTRKTPFIDREVYEDITKVARFDIYNRLSSQGVLLGHHKDDCIENIISNISKGTRFDNLKGMKESDTIMNVTVQRPFLNVFKNDVIEFAKRHDIPYITDNTSQTCARGKLRKNFIPACTDFNSSFPQSLLSLDNVVSDLFSIMNSYCDSICHTHSTSKFSQQNITVKIKNNVIDVPRNLPSIAWRTVINKMGIYNVSNRCIDNLTNKLQHSTRVKKHALNKYITLDILS